jgi:hypothetical protein
MPLTMTRSPREEPPLLFRSWSRLYAAVLIFLAVFIGFLFAVTRFFVEAEW